MKSMTEANVIPVALGFFHWDYIRIYLVAVYSAMSIHSADDKTSSDILQDVSGRVCCFN